MANKEFAQLKSLSGEELGKKIAESRDQLWNLKKDMLAGKVKNIKEIHLAKKDIARMLTAKRANSQKPIANSK